MIMIWWLLTMRIKTGPEGSYNALKFASIMVEIGRSYWATWSGDFSQANMMLFGWCWCCRMITGCRVRRGDRHDTVSLTLTDAEQSNLTTESEQANVTRDAEQAKLTGWNIPGIHQQQPVLWTRVTGRNLWRSQADHYHWATGPPPLVFQPQP